MKCLFRNYYQFISYLTIAYNDLKIGNHNLRALLPRVRIRPVTDDYNHLKKKSGKILKKLICMWFGFAISGDTSDILNELQNRLNQVLDQLAGTFAKNLEPNIQSSIKEMSKKLSQVIFLSFSLSPYIGRY